MAIAAFYIGLNALLMLILVFLVGSKRGKQNALDPGATGDVHLTRAIRAHANFSEYAALVLLVLLAMAQLGYSAPLLHLVGVSFTAGRILHAIGMGREKHPNAPRFIGNLTTGLCLLGGGLACIFPLLRG